jgi:hypothetical protein
VGRYIHCSEENHITSSSADSFNELWCCSSIVAALDLVYFVASEALELVENLRNINDFSSILKKIQIYNIKILVYHIVSHKYKGDNISIFNYLSPEKHN